MKLNGIVTNIRALWEELKKSYAVKKLLRAVPIRFLQITFIMEQFGNLDTMTMEEAMGSLKAHDERIKEKIESSEEGKLMLTKEEWRKIETSEGKLLLTREEWLRHGNKSSEGQLSFTRNRDKSRIRCFNCSLYGHFAAEYRKPKRNREHKQESNLTQIEDDEPALLLEKIERKESNLLMLDEGDVRLRLALSNEGKISDSNLWYLDNGASNYITGLKFKFKELDE